MSDPNNGIFSLSARDVIDFWVLSFTCKCCGSRFNSFAFGAVIFVENWGTRQINNEIKNNGMLSHNVKMKIFLNKSEC